MNIISIDPAVSKKIAYAVFLEDRLRFYDLVDEVIDVKDVLASGLDLEIVVTEDMYNGPDFSVVKRLCYTVGEIRILAHMYGLECRLIPPWAWKKHHGILIKKPAAREAHKAAKAFEDKVQFEIIKQYTGKEIQDEDLRAAVLIGMCYIEKARMGAV